MLVNQGRFSIKVHLIKVRVEMRNTHVEGRREVTGKIRMISNKSENDSIKSMKMKRTLETTKNSILIQRIRRLRLPKIGG